MANPNPDPVIPIDPSPVVEVLVAVGDPGFAPLILDDILRFLQGIERVVDQVLAIVFTILRIIGKILWLFGG
ncbi:hypothetical protein BRD00_09775 [Halobacteriales archaeon QS_8_69_26]|nr:MAG: hypothetical protein BRD00_09775 [Halobacteriales archaeon QS_8_69_26]